MAVAIRYPSRALAVLAVALPVPLLAAAGLSLPLPATVARLAANLVPFGNPAALAAPGDRPAHGSIVLAPGEQPLPAAGTKVTPARPAGHGSTHGKQLSGRRSPRANGKSIVEPTGSAAQGPVRADASTSQPTVSSP